MERADAGVRLTNTAGIEPTEMEKIPMLTSKRVEGKVDYNDGSFAEVFTYGIEGIEEGLNLERIQLHIEDTQDTPQEFQQRFLVGMTLSILTITEITRNRVRRALQSNSGGPSSPELRDSSEKIMGKLGLG